MSETRLTRSMTRDEFRDAVREALTHRHSTLPDVSGLIAEYAERAGVVWAPDPTPEPTIADGEIVRVVDSRERTWRRKPGDCWWLCIDDYFLGDWSDIPQPVTVLRPEVKP